MADGPEVVIVGAGIGGLAAALELHRVGIRCFVLEAVPRISPVGVGINVLPHAARILGELGLETMLAGAGILTQESAFFNRFGQFIYREPAGRYAGYPDPQYSIHRGDLQKVMLDAARDRLGEDAVRTGCRVTAVVEEAGRARVSVEAMDGTRTSVAADAVIGADGIHSVIRKQFFPHEGPPRYSGVNMWRGTTVWEPLLTGASMIRVGWLACGKLVLYPIREDVDGRGGQLLNWVAEVETPQRVDRDWNQIGRLEDFLSYFEDWHFDWLDVPSMLSSTQTVLEYPMVDQDPLPRWSHGRTTLLGDAAHPMVPRGSNGAGQAILDARALADCLTHSSGDVVAALAAYEDRRLHATAQVVLTNRANPPDAILREVYERSGDRPFERLSDVVSESELAALSASYKQVAGFPQPTG